MMYEEDLLFIGSPLWMVLARQCNRQLQEPLCVREECIIAERQRYYLCGQQLLTCSVRGRKKCCMNIDVLHYLENY